MFFEIKPVFFPFPGGRERRGPKEEQIGRAFRLREIQGTRRYGPRTHPQGERSLPHQELKISKDRLSK